MIMLYWLTYLDEKGYIITQNNRPLCKFGFTSNLKQRMNAYKTAIPLQLHIFAYRSGTMAEEQEFLKRYKHHIHRGEWMYYDSMKPIIDSWPSYTILAEPMWHKIYNFILNQLF